MSSLLKSIELIEVPDPAAQVDFNHLFANHFGYRIIACTATLVTDATVANRRPLFRFTWGGVTIMSTQHTAVQIASQTMYYSLAPVGFNPGLINSTIYPVLPIATDIMLEAPAHFDVTTPALAATDQWSNIRILVERWAYRTV